MKVTLMSLMVLSLLWVAATPAVLAADLDAAKENFGELCAKCHGETGRGDGSAASTLERKPKDFTDCAAMAKISDATMFKAIKGGTQAVGLGKSMPPGKDAFEDSEIHDLVAFVRRFCKH